MSKKITDILRANKNFVCEEKAKELEFSGHDFSILSFRSLTLSLDTIISIAQVFKIEKYNIKSISFSYNTLMGDAGASALSKSLPSSLLELGLVDCGIGDSGGYDILEWMKSAPNLQMVCIENNNFSDELKQKFNAFRKANPKIMVVY